jgi:DNA polymerase-3 subunit epsilon
MATLAEGGECVAFDLETTGVSSFRDAPVSYGFVQHVGGRIQSDAGYVNPGVPIPPGASAIHGITDEMVRDATVLAEATEYVARRLSSIWSSGGVVVGMNVAYDLTMVDALCRRLSLAPLEARGQIGAVVDVLVVDRHVDRWRKGGRKLTDLCRHYGVSLSDAHSALADAEASLEILEAQIAQFPEIAHLDVGQMNETLRGWYVEWLTSFSAYLERKGERPVAGGRFAWPLHVDE